MSRGSTELDNWDYDNWLAANKKEKELLERKKERRAANKGYEGWHFGWGKEPVYTKNKEEFNRELTKRGLGLYDNAKIWR